MKTKRHKLFGEKRKERQEKEKQVKRKNTPIDTTCSENSIYLKPKTEI